MVSEYSYAVEFDLKKHTCKKIAFDDLVVNFDNDDIIYWFNIELSDNSTLEKLQSRLKMSPQFIEFVNKKAHTVGFIDNDEEVMLQLPSIIGSTNENNYVKNDIENVFMYLTKKYCLTASFTEIPALVDFAVNYEKSIKFAKTTCFILFIIFDNVMNSYIKKLFKYEVLIEEKADKISHFNESTYKNLLRKKMRIMKMKRNLVACRQILMRLSSHYISVISEGCRLSLDNLLKHVQIIINEADSICDLINGLLAQIDNTLMQRLNGTIKLLTIFSAIFLPLTLVTGIYGMNFKNMPELNWHYGYFGSLGLMVAIAVFMLLLFRKLKVF